MGVNSYEIEAKVESYHWWFVVRKRLLEQILNSIKIPKDVSVIDIGCGTGSNLDVLKRVGFKKLFGLDNSYYALSLAKKKIVIPFVCGDINQLPIRSNSLGLIIAMDIIEHIDNDLNAIQEVYRVLEKGGYLILSVPAFKFLWGKQDFLTGHKRRYLKKEIINKLKSGHFYILKSYYLNFFLFFPIFFIRRIVHCLGLKFESENEMNFPYINFFLKAIFSLELHLLKYYHFPFGVSIFCIAKK